MFPSKNLFSPTTGEVMYSPSQEALLGLHLLSKWGKQTNKSYATIEAAKKALGNGEINVSDVIKISGAPKPTTVGRLMIAEKLPSGFSKNKDILHDPSFEVTKKSLGEHITSPMAKQHTDKFAHSINALKDLGNEWSFKLGFSMGLKDLEPLKERDSILAVYKKKAQDIASTVKDEAEKEKRLVANWTEATKKLDEAAKATLAQKGNRLATMIFSGARGKSDQLRQMIAAPMLMQDSTNRTIPTPVTRSYSEGLDIGDYWLAQHGARKGTLQRAMGTSEPGAISKDILNSTMSTLIVSPDCGTKQGILMSLVPKDDDKSYKDVLDRHTAASYKLKDGSTVKEGTLITPELVSRLRNSKHDKILVRSPLKCEHGDGICAKCYGLNENGHLHDVGTNIGVLAGQSLGEPAVQMAMDAFHSGGIASSERGAKSVDRFTRLRNLLEMPKKLRDEATVAQVSGKITEVKKDPTGVSVVVNGVRHFVPHNLEDPARIKVGVEVRKGDKLSEGYVNPHHLLSATKDIHAVQNYLVKEMHEGLYDKEGVRRRNVEVAIRATTNLTKIRDPGSSDHLPGDVVPRSVVEEHNRNLPKGAKPIEHEPILKGIEQVPGHISTNWMGRLNYRELHTTIQQAASQGWKSDLHGSHPIPGVAYGAEFGKPPPGKPKHVY
jgi:DNA-directed RNA polymerase subunit beta'